MARLNRLYPVALSILAAAEATQLPRRVIRAAVYDATLEARMVEGRVRIPVVCLVEWLRRMPRPTLKAARKGIPHE